MKIAFIGSRGVPAKYGGFETFVEQVALGLKNRYSVDVVVVGDKVQKANHFVEQYKGIEVRYSKYDKSKKPNLFYFESMMKAYDADVIYSCGVGGAFSLMVPLMTNKNYVTNPDGVGWHRDKWNPITKKLLKSMFYVTCKMSKYLVCDSFGIAKVMERTFNRTKNVEIIEYGAFVNPYINVANNEVDEVLQKYNLIKNQYHLVVSRLEPENNVDMIIEGYNKSGRKFPLIIVGNLNETEYVEKLKRLASSDIRFVGGIYENNDLSIVRVNAIDYLHGHSVGGTNPSLLEAMAAGNLCICHDNTFNKEVLDNTGVVFASSDELAKTINLLESDLDAPEFEEKRKEAIARIKNYYNWDLITDRYYEYFNKINS